MNTRPNNRSLRWLYHITLWGAFAAGVVLVGAALQVDPRPTFGLLLVFLTLALITELGYLTLPYPGYVSFGAVVALPAILIVGPAYAALFGAFGQFVSNLQRRRPLSTVVFNPGQKALCIAAAAAAWNLVDTGRPSLAAVHPGLYPDRVLPAALACVAVYTLATHIVVSLFSAARRGLPVAGILIGNGPMRIAAASALGAFGLLVALLALGVPTAPPNLQYLLALVVVGGLALLDWDFHRQTSRVQRAAFERGLVRAIGHRTALSVVNVSVDAPTHRSDSRFQDEALREVARLLTLEYRAQVDVVSRRGVTELVALLPQTGKTHAAALAGRIRQTVDDVGRGGEADQTGRRAEPRLVVRFGIASYPDDGGTVDALLRAADQATRALSPAAGGTARSA